MALIYCEGQQVKATCRRCARLFVYVQKTKPRQYCEPCALLERQDNQRIANRKCYELHTKPKRQRLREAMSI